MSLPRTITSGEKQVFLNLPIKCTWENDIDINNNSRVDIQGIKSFLPSGFNTGVIIDGVNYPLPMNGKQKITILNPGQPGTKITNFKFYFTMSEEPGTVFIPTDTIAEIDFLINSYVGLFGSIAIVPSNKTIFTSGTCKINDGRDINIDFGQVSKINLSSNSIMSKNSKLFSIQYKCKNPVTMPIKMWLSADNSSFSSSAIMTSNKDIGIETYYNNSLLKPGDSARTQLNSGIGYASLRFVLVKSQTDDVNTGPFRGSAVLVMSMD